MTRQITMSCPLHCQLVKDALAIIRGIHRNDTDAAPTTPTVVDDHREPVQVPAKFGAHKTTISTCPSIHSNSVDTNTVEVHGAVTVISQGKDRIADLALAYPEIYGEFA